ncbi:hypothetical protein U9M48_008860 [Paspalum notatum var. saurae]|uniref:Uncharacterized protein n=1 Tax=Paspalum notatum var. saurae TaxID=547442 RepID=A0AAQ3WE29_PASNO
MAQQLNQVDERTQVIQQTQDEQYNHLLEIEAMVQCTFDESQRFFQYYGYYPEYQNAHKIDENMPRIKYEAHFQSGQVGRPHHQVARPRGWPTPGQAARLPKSAMCYLINPHHEENTSALKSNRKTKHPMYPRAEKCTKSQILNVINPREKQNGQCRPDMWSPDLLQGRPTYPWRHFPRATTVLTANRHREARSRRWSAKAVDRVVARPQARSVDLLPRSADHRLQPPTDLSLLQIPPSHMGL